MLPDLPSSAPFLSPGWELFGSLIPWLLLAFLIVIGFLVWLRFFYKRMWQLARSFDRVTLLVTVPKFAKKDDDRPSKAEEIKEQIAVAETLFSAIGGLTAERGLSTLIRGRQDHLALEIVASEGLISFYVAVPRAQQRFIEQHIHAQYPAAQVDEVDSPNIFLPRGVAVGSTLTFQRSFIFPLKTYRELESDPLAAITNAMSRLGTNGAAIQLVVRSAKRGWHRLGRRTASQLNQGVHVEEALWMASASAIGRFFVHLRRAIAPRKKKDINPQDVNDPNRPHQLSALEQEMAKRIEQKTSKAGVDANLRVIVSAPTKEEADSHLKHLVDSFNQYSMYQYGNSFVVTHPRKQQLFLNRFIYRQFTPRQRIVLNTEELASLFHFPLPSTETPNIRWLRAKKAPAPEGLPADGVVLGKNVYRGDERVVRLGREDRRRHVYVIGTTGSGKSTLMQEMVKQDIANGEGVGIVDPHGSFVEDVLECIPKERADDVIYFDPSDVDRPIGLNMLEARSEAEMDFVTQEMIAIFYKLVSDPSMIGPMFEHNMRNAMFTLMADREHPGTIVEIPRMFTDQEFQKAKVAKVTDPVVRAFWEKEMAKTSDFHKSEMLGYLISKVGRFVENSLMRNIIGQSASGFNFREIMDEKKILLVNLSKGKIGDINSNLLGLIIVSKLQMAALARADTPSGEYPDFFLYIDEFQNFITDSIATILSEARKYKLNLTMAHQYMGQLVQGQDTKIRDAVLGNVGSMICYRIGVDDAKLLGPQFTPVFSEFDLVNIDRYRAYVKLLINNTVTRPFDIEALPPTIGQPRRAELLKQASRLKFGRPRQLVESEIMERSQLGAATAVLPSGAETVSR